jgi:hypothetical protein
LRPTKTSINVISPAWPSSSCHAATVPNAPTQAGISEMIELRRKDEKTMDWGWRAQQPRKEFIESGPGQMWEADERGMRGDDGWGHDPRDDREVSREPSDGRVRDRELSPCRGWVFGRRNWGDRSQRGFANRFAVFNRFALINLL